MLTALRQMFSEVNEEKFCCLLVFKQTELFSVLDNVLMTTAQTRSISTSSIGESNNNEQDVIKLEMLWVLLNIAYCCLSDKELDCFTENLLSHVNLKALLVKSMELN